jgi:hypothetical protein
MHQRRVSIKFILYEVIIMRRNIVKRGDVVPRWLKSDKVSHEHRRKCGVVGNLRRLLAAKQSEKTT